MTALDPDKTVIPTVVYSGALLLAEALLLAYYTFYEKYTKQLPYNLKK